MSVISFTKKEEAQLRNALSGYCDLMNEGYETSKMLEMEFKNGLGSALYKLYKGRNGAVLYERYVKKRSDTND